MPRAPTTATDNAAPPRAPAALARHDARPDARPASRSDAGPSARPDPGPAGEALRIEDPAVAAFLTDRVRSRHLDPFLGREATVAEAAKALGLGATRMSYWVGKLLDLGLIAQVGTRTQARHRVRVYRSVGDSFVLSLDLLASSDVEVLEQYFAPVWRRFLTSLAQAGRRSEAGWLVRFARTGDQAGFEIVPSSGDLEDARIFNAWAKLSLTREQATRLRHDLGELLERYAALQDPGGEPHWLHLAAVMEAAE